MVLLFLFVDCSSRSCSLFGWTTAFTSHAKSPRLLLLLLLFAEAQEEEKKSFAVGNRFSPRTMPLPLVVAPSDRRPVKLALEPVLALLESMLL